MANYAYQINYSNYKEILYSLCYDPNTLTPYSADTIALH